MRGRIVLAALIVAACASGVAALAAAPGSQTFPRPTGYVNDLAHLLDPSARAALEQRLADYDRATGNQIAVAIFPNLGGIPINDFAARLEEAWKVGRRGKDTGILLLVGVREREVRIEVGYGLEGRVTDGDAGTIIRNVIAPAFRAGRYGEGLEHSAFLRHDAAGRFHQVGDQVKPSLELRLHVGLGGIHLLVGLHEPVVRPGEGPVDQHGHYDDDDGRNRGATHASRSPSLAPAAQ